MSRIEELDRLNAPPNSGFGPIDALRLSAGTIYRKFPGILDFEARHRNFEIPKSHFEVMIDVFQEELEALRNEDFLESNTKEKPIFLHTFDSQDEYVFIPNEVRLNWQAPLFLDPVIEHNGIKVLRYKMSEERKKARIHERKVFGGSAWSERDAEGGQVWQSLANPEEFSVNDPTQEKNSKRQTIQSIIVGPIQAPFYFDRWEIRHEVIQYGISPEELFRWRVRHELAHIDEMNVRPWVGPRDNAFPYPERLKSYEALLAKFISHDDINRILGFHKPFYVHDQIPRSFIGELYAYMSEVYANVKNYSDAQILLKNGKEVSIAAWLLVLFQIEREGPSTSSNLNRDINNYPYIGKDTYPLEVISAILLGSPNMKEDLQSGEDLKVFLMTLKELMRS